MDAQKVDMFMVTNKKYFPNEKIPYIREKLSGADDSKFSVVSSVELKDPETLLIISIFLGSLGVDRFMVNDIGMGILKLLTGGLCGILTMIDWFLISNKVKEINYNNLMMVL